MGIVPGLRQNVWQFSSVEVVSVEEVPSSDLQCSPAQREKLDYLVKNYFEGLPNELGCTTVVSHRIEIESSPPIKLRSYPVSPKIQEHIDAELDRMLEQGVIKPSDSAWAFIVVMIRKRDNSYRFCVDYIK